ncbi:MAG: FAD-dependent monooxygenase [Nocardioidaceae bacterium]
MACVGGGPGGLFLGTLLRRARPDAEVVVFERNRPDDTFGFGVVFSNATLGGIHAADPVLTQGLTEYGAHWDEIEVRLHGERLRCGGNGMAAIRRKTLLALLHERAVAAGVELRFEHEVTDPTALDEYDLVVAADGANSLIRSRFAEHLQPSVEVASAKFIWFGTPYLFDGLTFVHGSGPDGVFAVHGYPYGREGSTFLVETDEASLRRAGLDEFDVAQPPGVSDEKSRTYLEALFAEQIDGRPLLTNNSRWASFRTIRTRTWHHRNVVLLGDAAHTAHFSVGSGTKMAMEDAVVLAEALGEHTDVETALEAYDAGRRPDVEKVQDSARPSLSWWEHFGRYHDSFEPVQFAFHFLTRSISRGKLARRDPAFVGQIDAWWRRRTGAAPLVAPLEAGGIHLAQRALRIHTTASMPAVPTAEGGLIPLVPAGTPIPAGGFGLWLRAPEAENQLPPAVRELEDGIAAGAILVAVHGGSRLTRTLLCEEARLLRKTPALMVDETLDADGATTVLLSGRADLVGAAPDVVAGWESM